MMSKQVNQMLLALMALTCSMIAGCEAIEGIFKAGVWAGVVVAVLAVALLAGVARLISRR